MKVTKLYTHWSTEEADTVIDFLDTLRDELGKKGRQRVLQQYTQRQIAAQTTAVYRELTIDNG